MCDKNLRRRTLRHRPQRTRAIWICSLGSTLTFGARYWPLVNTVWRGGRSPGGLLHRRWRPRPVEDRWALLPGPVHPQRQVERTLRGRQPVGLLVLARGLVLEVQRQGAVGVVLGVVSRTDGKPVQWVGDEPPALVDLVHGNRPEAVDRRRLALGEGQRVLVRPGQLLAVAVHLGEGVDGILFPIGR